MTRARAQGQLTACKSNLKNIGTALEMYSTDFSGYYPGDLGQLTPNYLKTIPQCPAAEEVTYGYKTGPAAPRNEEKLEFYYHLQCTGNHHDGVHIPADYPMYTSEEGLIDR